MIREDLNNFVGGKLINAITELECELTRGLNNKLCLEELPDAEVTVKTESSFKVVEGRLTEDRLIIQIYVWLDEYDNLVMLEFEISSHDLIFKNRFTDVVAKTINNAINPLAGIQFIEKEDFRNEFTKANNTMYHTTAKLTDIFIDI